MKNRIQKTLVFALITLSTVARADLSRRQLDEVSKSESSWRALSVDVPGYQGQVGAYVTDKGAVRIAQLPAVFESVGEIDKPSLKHVNDKILREWCSAIKMAFSAAKKYKEVYSLNLHLNPFANHGSINVAGATLVNSDIENGVKIISVRPRLDLAPNANSVVDTSINKADFEQAIAKQISQQSDALTETGDVSLDLTGWDDVACDLVQGYAKLKFAVTMVYEAPLVTRQVVISGDQMQQVYSGIVPYWKNQSGALRNYIMAGAILGGSMMTQLHKSPIDFGVDHFIEVFNQLFDAKSGALKTLSPSEVSPLALNLDVLKRGPTATTPIVQHQLSVKTR